MGTWLRRLHTVGNPRRRLVCLPHAGGTTSAFAGWPSQLPDDVEMVAVQYPGRQDRLSEPCIEDMHEMADALTVELRKLLDLPMTTFGHSMGSGLSYEVARRLARDDGFVVDRMFVSARPAPHRIDGEHRWRLSDEDLVTHMRQLGGPDTAVYDHPQLLPLILPPLRADLRLLDVYRPESMERLETPITVFGGEFDDTCPVADLHSWKDATSAECEVRTFPGGHHYLREFEQDVIGLVVEKL